MVNVLSRTQQYLGLMFYVHDYVTFSYWQSENEGKYEKFLRLGFFIEV